MKTILITLFVMLGVSSLFAQTPQPPHDEAGLVVPDRHSLEHRPAPPRRIIRTPLPACHGTIAATSDVDLRFHTGDHPIDLACGSEAERTMRFHQLGAWITDRWHGRQFLGVDGDIDATQPMRLHSVVRLMQQRQRLSVNHMNLVQALEQDCRCRTGYALNARGEAWPSDEVR